MTADEALIVVPGLDDVSSVFLDGGDLGIVSGRFEFNGCCHICDAMRLLDDGAFIYFNFILVIYVKKKYKLLPTAFIGVGICHIKSSCHLHEVVNAYPVREYFHCSELARHHPRHLA